MRGRAEREGTQTRRAVEGCGGDVVWGEGSRVRGRVARNTLGRWGTGCHADVLPRQRTGSPPASVKRVSAAAMVAPLSAATVAMGEAPTAAVPQGPPSHPTGGGQTVQHGGLPRPRRIARPAARHGEPAVAVATHTRARRRTGVARRPPRHARVHRGRPTHGTPECTHGRAPPRADPPRARACKAMAVGRRPLAALCANGGGARDAKPGVKCATVGLSRAVQVGVTR